MKLQDDWGKEEIKEYLPAIQICINEICKYMNEFLKNDDRLDFLDNSKTIIISLIKRHNDISSGWKNLNISKEDLDLRGW